LAPTVSALHAELPRVGRRPEDVSLSLKMSVRFTDGPVEVGDAELPGGAGVIVRVIERYADPGVDLIVLDHGLRHIMLNGALRVLDRFEREVRPRVPPPRPSRGSSRRRC
jgi:hypothetical protein